MCCVLHVLCCVVLCCVVLCCVVLCCVAFRVSKYEYKFVQRVNSFNELKYQEFRSYKWVITVLGAVHVV